MKIRKATFVCTGMFLLAVTFAGCSTASPFIEGRMAYQINPWSDWVLQPERRWTPDESETRLHVLAGLEWDNNVSCFGDSMLVGPWSQTFIGCAKMFGSESERGWFIQPELRHQVDSLTSDFLGTDQKQWQGHNPFLHVRAGYRLSGFRLNLATGKSLFQGAPFEREEMNPDLYWTNIEVSARFGGKTGMWK